MSKNYFMNLNNKLRENFVNVSDKLTIFIVEMHCKVFRRTADAARSLSDLKEIGCKRG